MFISSKLKYPDAEVRGLIEFAASQSKADLSLTQVNVKNTTGSIAGRAYYEIPKIANAIAGATTLVVLRVGKEFPASNMCYELILKKYKNKRWYERKATHPYGGKSSPLMEFADWQEGLVALAAHEFNHIHQYQNKLRRSEVECEKAANAALMAFREMRTKAEQHRPYINGYTDEAMSTGRAGDIRTARTGHPIGTTMNSSMSGYNISAHGVIRPKFHF